MQSTFIASGVRLPIGSFQGKLSAFQAPQLGGMALREVMARVNLPPEVLDEVLMGCVLTAGVGQAPARQAAKLAGIPDSVGALTVNKVCGSSLKAVMLADQMIRSGDAGVIACGGMESMTHAPYYLPKVRSGLRMGHGQVLDGMIWDGLWDPYNQFHMGRAGDRCARLHQISRVEQDKYALESYHRAFGAVEKAAFQREIVPVEIPAAKGEREIFAEDEEIRRGMARLQGMGQLKPAFGAEGTVTAANASKISDGAAAVLVVSEKKAKELRIAPRFRIVGQAQAAALPEDFPVAPVFAVKALEKKTGISLAKVDRFEINEAFAVVSLKAIQDLQLDPAKVNARGGAIALGHPIGASGARLLVTLMHELEDMHGRLGVATLCLGGGEAVALMVERL